MKAQDKFKTKYTLEFPLGSDETHAMLEAYGVWAEKSMYGKTYMGVSRATLLIGRDGKVAQVWPQSESGRPRRRGAQGRAGARLIAETKRAPAVRRAPVGR